MNTKENCLRALGSLVSMAIDNTKGSKAVGICHKEILAYICGLETENKKVWQRYKEEHSQITKALDKISKLKPFIPNEIPSWLDELEKTLTGD